MNEASRDKLIAEIYEECARIRGAKSPDYAGDVDVLLNFKSSAARLGQTKYDVLGTLLDKQLQVIFNSIQRVRVRGGIPDIATPGGEPMRSRIADAINYLYLFEAMRIEDMEAVGA